MRENYDREEDNFRKTDVTDFLLYAVIRSCVLSPFRLDYDIFI
jgi:hypothetical protein